MTMTTSGNPVSSSRSGMRGLVWISRVAWVRLRFLLVLGVAFGAVAGWDVIRNSWDKLSRGAVGGDPGSQVVSGNTEYFCPMDPGVVGDWPAKCPICNMTLVRRARGDVAPLPDGVIARMQLSPYRLQLGGIQTAAVEYRPIARLIEGPGHVRNAAAGEEPAGTAEVEIQVFRSELTGVAVGQEAEVMGNGGIEPLRAAVRSIAAPPDSSEDAVIVLEVPDPNRGLAPGARVRGRVRVPAAAIEPFRSLQVDPPAPRTGERRRVYACPMHPDVVREGADRCPKDQGALARRDLTDHERLRWWCPMHPEVTADAAGGECRACGGMKLVARVVHYAPRGQVLSVPEIAVIDTGRRTVVYVEAMPGMFDGVEVVLGPRCGDFYPVVRGVAAGQRVAATGAFLVDAETRLNPSVAAAYFGAARKEPPTSATPGAADETGSADAALAARQNQRCPVTGKKLGSMGKPVRLEIAGRVVLLCCEGCEPKLRAAPDRYLGKLPPEP